MQLIFDSPFHYCWTEIIPSLKLVAVALTTTTTTTTAAAAAAAAGISRALQGDGQTGSAGPLRQLGKKEELRRQNWSCLQVAAGVCGK
jgi:hypothetical protein